MHFVCPPPAELQRLGEQGPPAICEAPAPTNPPPRPEALPSPLRSAFKAGSVLDEWMHDARQSAAAAGAEQPATAAPDLSHRLREITSASWQLVSATDRARLQATPVD